MGEVPKHRFVAVEVFFAFSEVDFELFDHFFIEVFEEFAARIVETFGDVRFEFFL